MKPSKKPNWKKVIGFKYEGVNDSVLIKKKKPRIPLWPDANPCDRKLCRYCGNGYKKKKRKVKP